MPPPPLSAAQLGLEAGAVPLQLRPVFQSAGDLGAGSRALQRRPIWLASVRPLGSGHPGPLLS